MRWSASIRGRINGCCFTRKGSKVERALMGERHRPWWSRFFDLKEALQFETLKLRATRDLLLPKPISGELPVEAADGLKLAEPLQQSARVTSYGLHPTRSIILTGNRNDYRPRRRDTLQISLGNSASGTASAKCPSLVSRRAANSDRNPDLDILVEFSPDVTPGWDFFGLEAAVSDIFGEKWILDPKETAPGGERLRRLRLPIAENALGAKKSLNLKSRERREEFEGRPRVLVCRVNRYLALAFQTLARA